MNINNGIASFPQHSTPTSKQHVPYTQMQFNLGAPIQRPTSSQYLHKKPRPIIIEKLLPHQAKPPTNKNAMYSGNNAKYSVNGIRSSDVVLPNEKLALAVQLAKMDIKKLKNMLHSDQVEEVEGIIPHSKVQSPKPKVKKKAVLEGQPNFGKKVVKKKLLKEDVHKLNREPKKHVIHLYPEPNNAFTEIPKPGKKTTSVTIVDEENTKTCGSGKQKELVQLRKDVVKYSQTLGDVVDKLNKTVFVEDLKNDEELKQERERNILRAEEQGNRSARTLYMLQRQLEDLQHTGSPTSNVRQTKKSQYLKNLASVHRAAVRALQSFVKHVPLYYNNTGKLPSIYKTLALLIQELTSLSRGSELDFETKAGKTIERLIVSLSKSNLPLNQTKKTSVSKKDQELLNKSDYLDKRTEWLKKKAEELNIKSFNESEGSTPNRAPSLRHAIHALDENQENQPITRPYVKQTNISPYENKMKNLPNKPTQKNKTKPKSSVLLPEYKKKRLNAPPKSSYRSKVANNKNFAADTVVSKIRMKPPVERKEKTPPPSPRKYVVFRDDEEGPTTPRKRDQKIIDEARALLSPKGARSPLLSPKGARSPVLSSPSRSDNLLPPSATPSAATSPSRSGYLSEEQEEEPCPSWTPTKVRLMEKEIARDRWLEERTSKHLSGIKALEKVNSKQLGKLNNELLLSNRLIGKAEEQIKERLTPLVAKAQVISDNEKLTEYILDDLLIEAALDMQRIEESEEAETKAASRLDNVNLEAVAHRIAEMEREEEEIRRRWKNVQYSEVDTNALGTNTAKVGCSSNKVDLNTSHTKGKFVLFTAPERKDLPPTPDSSNVGGKSNEQRNNFGIPEGSLSAILSQRKKFEVFLEKSIHKSWRVEPIDVLEELSEMVLDEVLVEVTNELNQNCGRFVDEIYEKEFLTVS